MSLIVDGYNVILTAGLLEGARPGQEDPSALNRSRFRLIELVARYQQHRRRQPHAHHRGEVSIVVFDAKNPPAGLPSTFTHHGVTVLFAVDYDEADDLIEHLIRIHTSPKQLTVVSSDHRLQSAARRRKARFIDVDDWLDQMEISARKAKEPNQPKAAVEKSETPEIKQSGQADVGEWLDYLQIDDAQELIDEIEQSESSKSESDAVEIDETLQELFGMDFDAQELDAVIDVFPTEWLSEIQDEVDREKL